MFQLIRPHRLIPAHLFQPKMNQSLRISGFLGGVLKLVQSTEYQALYRSRRHIPSSWTRGTFQQLATATWKCGATATTSIQQIVVLTMKVIKHYLAYAATKKAGSFQIRGKGSTKRFI
jgi:hypothetical protein